MPITAKLSRAFYDRLGEDIANELVDWFNAVDATYRSDLRELNELNFARFDAKLAQRMTELEAKLERRIAAVETTFEQRIAALEMKFEQRIAALEMKFEQRISALETKLERRMAELEARVERRIADVELRMAELDAKFERRLNRQTRQLFATILLAWATLLVPILGLWLR
ncbi:MAG TPA: hypothetical protein VM099_04480 [Gemmatimonadaceae bacterium]|nr:hypothetical protein [Gemmatimonadaceae bacterium]